MKFTKEQFESMNKELQELQFAYSGLSLYNNLFNTQIGKTFCKLLNVLHSDESDPLDITFTYHKLLGLLGQDTELSSEPCIGDAWQNFLLNFIISDENALSLKAQISDLKELSPSLLQAGRYDLKLLYRLFHATPLMKEYYLAKIYNSGFTASNYEEYPSWERFTGLPQSSSSKNEFNLINMEIKNLFLKSNQWENCLQNLVEFYQQKGCGIYAKYIAFKWSEEDQNLRGISDPDPIRLYNLIGYERERSIIIENTKQFLAGYSSNNILLYGDRGTGKSSTVKALLNEFWKEGLRLIELTRGQLNQLPLLLKILKSRPQKFILFVDDLSFDDTEHEFLNLKTLLEGSLEAKPSNVLIYATSNRRHLIKERFSDRDTNLMVNEDKELRTQDTLQEKLSLSDRFGITVIFPAPNQKNYLDIVEALAKQRGISLDPNLLRQRAIQWSMLNNGFSGRTAKQFIDHLDGELKML